MELQVGVKVLLKNKEGKYLLLKRAPKADAPGKWDMAGGRIHPESSLMENLQREVRDETGLTITGVPRLVGAQDIFTPSGRRVVRLTYVGQADGEVVLSEEHAEHGWFTLTEVKLLEDLDRFLKELIDKGLIS
jgi:8-oxo-dGTP diphosphatase